MGEGDFAISDFDGGLGVSLHARAICEILRGLLLKRQFMILQPRCM
jgi:hypothetical protein